MSSFPIAEQEESLFLLDEQPPPNLQRSASFDDDNKPNSLKSIQRILSASSALTTPTTSTNRYAQQPPYRSLSAHDLAPPLPSSDSGLPPTHHARRSPSTLRSSTNEIDSFVRQFETRLREHRLLWQKEYDTTVQRMNESKQSELDALRARYETKLKAFEDGNKQLETVLEQMNEENKRLKFDIENQKQQIKVEQVRGEFDARLSRTRTVSHRSIR